MDYEYSKEGVEHLIEMSRQNDSEQIKQAADLLIPFLRAPEAIHRFLEILAEPKSIVHVLASILYLKKSMIIQWQDILPQTKETIFQTIINLYFTYPNYKTICIDIIQIFLSSNSTFFQFLAPYLTKEMTPENVNTLILFYSDFINYIPIEFLEQNLSSIAALVQLCFSFHQGKFSEPSSIELLIDSFRISAFFALKFGLFELVQIQIQSICELILKAELTNSQFFVLFRDLKSIVDITLDNQEIQASIYTVAASLVSNQDLIASRRNYAIYLIQSQIESGILPKDQIYFLIAQYFEIFASQIDQEDDLTYFKTNIIQYASQSIESSELFENVFRLILSNLESQDVKLITTSIYFLGFLMLSCPSEFHEHETESLQILQQALQPSTPPIIQFAALYLIQDVEDNFEMFPSVLCEPLLSIIFDSNRLTNPTNELFIENVLNAFFSLMRISTFNNFYFLDLLWSNKAQFIQIDCIRFYHILFHCATGIDELPNQILRELLELALIHLNLDTDPNLLRESLLLIASLVNFNHDIWPVVSEKIQFIIDVALKSESEELLNIIYRFLYVFVNELQEVSFEMIGQPFCQHICENLSFQRTDRSMMALAVICKYWNMPQLESIVYRHALHHIQENNDQDNDDDIDDSPFTMLGMISQYTNDDESLELFKLCVTQAKLHPAKVVILMKTLIENASEKNKDSFVVIYGEMIQQVNQNNNQDLHLLNLIYELSSCIFSIETETSVKLFSQIIPMIINILHHYGEISNSAIDYYIGILCDALENERIDQALIQLLFMTVYQIVLKEPPVDLWQNISFFFNSIFNKYPQFLNGENFPLSSFVMTLYQWLQSMKVVADEHTLDNVASLLLTICASKRIEGNDQILQLSISRFPPTDLDEFPNMSTSIIRILTHKPQYSIDVYCQIAASIASALTMNEKKKSQIHIDEQIFPQFISILNDLLKSPKIVEFVKSSFENEPEKFLQISQPAS